MNKIQKVSTYLLSIFNVLLLTTPLIIILQWLFIETKVADAPPFINFFGILERTISTPHGYVNLSDVAWTLPTKFVAFGSDILRILPFLLSLFVLRAIVKNYQKNEIFSTKNAVHFKKLGGLFLLNALLVKSLSETILLLGVSFTNPPGLGLRYLTLSFGTPNLEALFCGILLIVFSWVMLEASKLQDDQKFTI